MPILTPRVAKELLPLSFQAHEFIEASRSTLRAIASEKERKLLIIAGPCSIHDHRSALEYAAKFKQLAKQVEETCFLVMRVFFEKSRTQHGWCGFIHDPDLDGSHNLEKGIMRTRELLVLLAEEEIPVCSEFLHPLITPYCEDLVTLGIIGARTCTSQVHRHLASSLSMPVGFKNSIDGNIESALQGIVTARESQHLLTVDQEGRLHTKKTAGNPDGWLVMRGSQLGANYDKESLDDAMQLSQVYEVPQRFIIDCAHGNSGKCIDQQKSVFQTCLSYLEEGRQEIMGLMLESHLEKGTQSMNTDSMRFGLSITDPCLDWLTTAQLIKEAHFTLKRDSVSSLL